MKSYITYPIVLFAATCLFSCGATNGSVANSDVTKAVEGKVGGVMLNAAPAIPNPRRNSSFAG